MRPLVWVLWVLSLCGVSLAADARPAVAVSDFSAAGIQPSEAQLMTSRFQSALGRTGTFTVLERSQIQNILNEQGFQQTGACDSESCRIRMGQLLGVDYLVAGEIGKIGQKFVVTIRLLDVGTGAQLFSVDGEHDGTIEETFSSLMPAMAKAVSGKYEKSHKSAAPVAVAPVASAPAVAPALPVAEAPTPAAAVEPAEPVAETTVATGIADAETVNLESKSSGWNWVRISALSVTALAIGGAVFSHIEYGKYSDDADAAKAKYDAVAAGGDFDTPWNEYTDNHDKAKTYSTYRAVCAGIAAVGLAVTVVTFF